ncbi:MAG TPA: helix-turn-helix domain-containing protein [Vicinamibacterales bacterium]|nr:helix-turn-helix domain-containing protein [Vicinamibacterales bacterium]
MVTNPSPGDDPWLTATDAATYLSVHTATLRRAIKAGALRAARVSGRTAIRIRRSWLDEYMEATSTPVEVERRR